MDLLFSLPTLVFSPAALAAVVAVMYWIWPTPLLHGYQLYGGYLVAGLSRKFLHLKDISFSYFDRPASGSEPHRTLVFVHGFTSNKSSWLTVAKHLPKQWRMIILDMPGHGESTFVPDATYSTKGLVDKLHLFIEGLDLRNIHLVGESMGGLVVAAYAAYHPERLQSIALLCPLGAHKLPDVKKSKFFLTLEQTRKNSILPEDPDEFQQMLELVLYNHEAYTFHYRMRQAILGMQLPKYTYFRKIQDDMFNANEDQEYVIKLLSGIQLPALIIWGEHDRVCDPSGAAVMSKWMKNSQLIMLERCGHAITLDRPRKCAKLLSEFISKQNDVVFV